GELMLLVEYCRFGNILQFMQKNRNKFINQLDSITGEVDSSLSTPVHITANRMHCNSYVDEDGYLEKNDLRKISQSSNTQNIITQTSVALENPRSCVGNPGYCLIGNNSSSGLNASERESHSASAIDQHQPNGESESESKETCYTRITGATRMMNSDCSYMSMSSHVSSPGTHHVCGSKGDYQCNYVPMSENYKISGRDLPFTTSDLIIWSWQIASGMNYLSHRKIMHGDLAARNILLADNNVVKISDFGLSRDIYKKDVYMKKGDDLLPIKWMSIEAIRDRIFSTQSDIWSYGVTVWEIFTLGSSPYPGVNLDRNFLSMLETGHRMDMPQYGNKELYVILLECWSADPRLRPDFNSLIHRIGELLHPEQRTEYLKMNDPYLQMNREFFSERTDYLQMLSSPDYNIMTQGEKDYTEDSGIENISTSYQPAVSNSDQERGNYMRMDLTQDNDETKTFTSVPLSIYENERYCFESKHGKPLDQPTKGILKEDEENLKNSKKNSIINQENTIEERGRFTVMKSEESYV
ncbi:unnamed protein product, partial [Meganyctiphanes norvegica]